MRARGIIVGLAILVVHARAGAQSEGSRFAGPHEVSGTFGAAVGLTERSPGGGRNQNEYGYRLTETLWLNLQLSVTSGTSYPTGGCSDAGGNPVTCWGGFSGNAVELIAGIKLKFPHGRLVPYAKLGGGVAIWWWDGDYSGTALVARGGGGMKYYVIRRLAVGGEVMASIGPGFLAPSRGGGTHTYAELDVLVGVEFNF